MLTSRHSLSRSAVAAALGALSIAAAPRIALAQQRTDADRVNSVINLIVNARRFAPEKRTAAINALKKESAKPEIYNALMFAYAADVMLNYEKPTAINKNYRNVDHFLKAVALDLIRKPPSGFDAIAAMATSWDRDLGQPRIRYSGFDELTPEKFSWAVSVRDDTASLRAMNDYIHLRDGGESADGAFEDYDIAGRVAGLRDNVFYFFGRKLLTSYSLFDAGRDSRDYLEAHYQYWLHQGDTQPPSVFVASDPMAMLSRRVIRGIRDDRDAALRKVEEIISEATREQTVVTPTPSPNVPSFDGLENRPVSQSMIDELLEIVPKIDPFEDHSTTAGNYERRVALLANYSNSISAAKRDEIFQWPSTKALLIYIDGIRRREGDQAAYDKVSYLIGRIQLAM